MEKRNLIFFSFFICLFFLVANLNLVVANNFNHKLKMAIPYNNQIDFLAVHVPILIDSNSDFTTFSSQGNGSQSNPFIIENYVIDASDQNAGIKVTSTTAYFKIRNCSITTDFIGIHIGSILTNTCILENNTCLSKTGDGGGLVFGSLTNAIVINNTCVNFMQGIHLNYAHQISIKNNNFKNCNYQGINIRYSNKNIIMGNLIKNCTEHGIAFVGTSNLNIFHHNIVINCSQVETYNIDGERTGPMNSYGYDEGTNNIWYDEENKCGNYWSDYSGSGPYSIDGPANAEDIYPNCSQTQVNPINPIYYFVALLITLTAGIITAKRKKEK